MAREIKSGKITLESTNFKRQIMADMAIINIGSGGINKIEWHFLEGITDDAMQYIYTEIKKNGLLGQNKFVVYIYE